MAKVTGAHTEYDLFKAIARLLEVRLYIMQGKGCTSKGNTENIMLWYGDWLWTVRDEMKRWKDALSRGLKLD